MTQVPGKAVWNYKFNHILIRIEDKGEVFHAYHVDGVKHVEICQWADLQGIQDLAFKWVMNQLRAEIDSMTRSIEEREKTLTNMELTVEDPWWRFSA